MISNSISFDRYGLKSSELAQYFRGNGSDAQWGNKIKRNKITFHTNFWARGDAETYLHGTRYHIARFYHSSF